MEKAILEGKKESKSFFEIHDIVNEFVKISAQNGNEEAIEMLYIQMKYVQLDITKKFVVKNFFANASNKLKEENAERILRHILIKENFFSDKDDIKYVIEKCKESLDKSAFERNPELETRINEIQEEALNKRTMSIETESSESVIREENAIEVTEFVLNESQIPIQEDVGDIDAEKEELQALQKISEGVTLVEKNKGKEMIKLFLSKAKELKDKIGQFLRGGDNHDDR